MTTNDIRTVVELKSCPFCGKTPDLVDATAHLGCWRLVHRCSAMGYLGYESSERNNIITAWNTRTQPTAMAEMMQVIELCREALLQAHVVCHNRHEATTKQIEVATAAINKLSASAQGE